MVSPLLYLAHLPRKAIIMDAKPSLLLKILSIFFILSGAITIVISLSAGFFIIGTESSTAAGVATVLACIGGILQLAAGFFSLGRKYGIAYICSGIILTISVISLVVIMFTVFQGNDPSALITGFSQLLFPILFFLAINIQIRKAYTK